MLCFVRMSSGQSKSWLVIYISAAALVPHPRERRSVCRTSSSLASSSPHSQVMTNYPGLGTIRHIQSATSPNCHQTGFAMCKPSSYTSSSSSIRTSTQVRNENVGDGGVTILLRSPGPRSVRAPGGSICSPGCIRIERSGRLRSSTSCRGPKGGCSR